ncbi:Niacin transporter NiaP [[Actinomadura] parvosata subsp. kistnae]|uniref:MFS transporter n=1 Tax=[Actinomadura] parvosata subsp. kistnae TaxID=1909395 RepID=A0A1U9ZU82_9ACTN|nr:MFS transporter [Nonomuraea sp. ATCC 55076]AQZ61506.1 MFS transporter [Nonomuraea sp. ATCC 55076]SPL98217.1 Niacin transporter NiaP [Actinomadura parvosata subsp. kistnae]
MTAIDSPSLPIGAAFDRMPFTRRHVLIALALFVAFVIESWEQLALVYVSGDLGAKLGIDEAGVGVVLSAVAFGMIPGVLVWGPVADRIGRRPTAFWSLLAYGVVALASAFAPNATVLVALRVASGLALAGVYTITFPLFLELLPTRHRGRAAVYLSIGWPIGMLAAIGASMGLGGLGWHVVVIASAVAGLWAFAIRAWVPESPYWLAARGRQEEARAVLRSLGSPDAEATFTVARHRAGRPLDLFRGGLARITLVMLALNFVFNWGYWGLQTWLPTLLQERGLTLSASLGFAALSALMMIPGYVSASLLTGRFGRKPVFLVYVVAAALGGLWFATAESSFGLYAGNFVLAFFSMGAWGVWNTWNGEFYPTALRGTGYSWATAAQLVATTVAPSAVGALLANATGFTATMLIINAFMVATALLAVPLPETEGRELE